MDSHAKNVNMDGLPCTRSLRAIYLYSWPSFAMIILYHVLKWYAIVSTYSHFTKKKIWTLNILLLGLNLKEDIAGATFMATASSSPELFINCVGTFVTEGDIGVGTIVGSAVFNVLAVPACCGLFANMVHYWLWSTYIFHTYLIHTILEFAIRKVANYTW